MLFAQAPTITEYNIPTPGGNPQYITLGPDGALWFTEGEGKIGRISIAGTIAKYPVPTDDGFPDYSAAGPDGALWSTRFGRWKGHSPAPLVVHRGKLF
jgi:virginiamycin B lyase